MLLHIILFDKSYNLTYWLNYSELRFQLRKRYFLTKEEFLEYSNLGDESLLSIRLKKFDKNLYNFKNNILQDTKSSNLEVFSLLNFNYELNSLFISFYFIFYNLETLFVDFYLLTLVHILNLFETYLDLAFNGFFFKSLVTHYLDTSLVCIIFKVNNGVESFFFKYVYYFFIIINLNVITFFDNVNLIFYRFYFAKFMLDSFFYYSFFDIKNSQYYILFYYFNVLNLYLDFIFMCFYKF
jgi:hypothetical protein